MTAQEIDRLRRIETIFDAALELAPGAERDAFLCERSATDSGLLDEVRELLENHARVSAAAPQPAETLPRFGAWQAIRLLGRGGMGTVYLADRADGAFQMTAAVKVAPLAIASSDIEERFRRERQFLASLDHPKVARLIDGGVTASGLPYLVMEFVDGFAIDRYCDTQRLDRRARIALMRQVLEALIYVHGRGLIHRDLKPSNILVDAAGNARLLDFGTARLVDASGDTAITKTGVYAFTPDYASPEQAQGKPPHFASDIYSAGMLLYRLLTGHAPYRFTDYSASAVAETISRAEPEPTGLDKGLDAILSASLRKNPGERYASAAEMDADLARYLKGQSVQARVRAPKKAGRAAAVGAVIALCVLAAWFFLHGNSVKNAASPSPSIAVLPFSNSNQDPSNEYLADGLTGEITGELGQLKTLRVAAQSATALYRKQPRSVRDIGKWIGVSHVLEASVERSGDRIKIVASLERTSDGAKLWTNTYQRATADLNIIETDLEARVAASLGIAGPAPLKKHVPPEAAHQYYLKACFESDQISLAANALAQQDFRRALELDPDYALAYAGLGGAIWNRSNAAGEHVTPEEIRKSEQLWQKAIRLDPDLTRAHVALAMFAMQYDWDWNRAERELQAAISLAPSSGAEMNFATLCLILGRRQEADDHFQRARDLDPLSAQAGLNFAQFLAQEGRSAESREEIWKIATQSPTSVRLQIRLNFMDAWLGTPGAAIQNLRKFSQREPFAGELLAEAEAHAGKRDEAIRIIRPLERNYQDGHLVLTWAAETYALMNDEPNTVKWLGRAIDAREGGAAYIHVDPAFAKFQDTPAFHSLKKRMDLDW